MTEQIKGLEEKIAYLERHVAEQDKAMLEFSRTLDALRREFKVLRDRATTQTADAGEARATDERPPHY